MRTTLTIEDRTVERLKNLAHSSGKTFKQVVNEVLLSGLEVAGKPARRTRFKQKVFDLGEPRPGYDLNKALALASGLEDAEIARKLAMRK